MSNIREVAKQAGVSIATVSRYINDPTLVGDKTAENIKNTIEKLNYIPNAHAKAIFAQETKTFGLIIPTMDSMFFSRIALLIELEVSNRGYGVILVNVNADKNKEATKLKSLLEDRVDGIFVVKTDNPELYKNLDIPCVAIENGIPGLGKTVISNNYKGGYESFMYLFNKGARQIVYVCIESKNDTIEQRKKGFLDASMEKSLNVDFLYVSMEDKSSIDYDTLCEMEKYDGIFTYNDITAYKIMQYFSSIGKHYELGKSIFIIGYDNVYMSSIVSPPLTTISQNLEELSKSAVDILFGLIEGKKDSINDIVIDVELVERGT